MEILPEPGDLNSLIFMLFDVLEVLGLSWSDFGSISDVLHQIMTVLRQKSLGAEAAEG